MKGNNILAIKCNFKFVSVCFGKNKETNILISTLTSVFSAEVCFVVQEISLLTYEMCVALMISEIILLSCCI